MTTIVTLVIVATFCGIVYALGYAQGRSVQKHRVLRREAKMRWMLDEALRLWAPWTLELPQAKAVVANAYAQREVTMEEEFWGPAEEDEVVEGEVEA